MTTIAYKDGVLACDSAITDGHLRIIGGGLNKFFRFEDDDGAGCWVACAGSLSQGLRFVQWFCGHNDELTDKEQDEMEALVLYDDGTVELYDACLVPSVWDPTRSLAIGSGAAIAMAAMACGKTAAEAVELACEMDIYTAGPVLTGEVAAPSTPP